MKDDLPKAHEDGPDDFPAGGVRPRDRIHVDTTFATTVRQAATHGLVSCFPTYLLDFVIWPHHGGPGCGRVLVTWDGLLLGQRSLKLTMPKVFDHADTPFEDSLHSPWITRESGETMRAAWLEVHPSWGPWSESDSSIALDMAMGVSRSLHTFNSGSSSEGHKDQLYTLVDSGNTVVDIRGVWINPEGYGWDDDMRASLGVPFQKNRSLWDRSWGWSSTFGELVAQALAAETWSDRGCIAMLRTAAERFLQELGEREGVDVRGKDLENRIESAASWFTSQLATGDKSSTRAAANARAAVLVGALHRVRDIGNRVHNGPALSRDLVTDAKDAMDALLRASSSDGAIFRS